MQFPLLLLIVLGVVLVAMLSLSRTRLARSWSSPVRSRLIVYVVGTFLSFLPAVLRGGSVSPRPEVAFGGGIAWLVFFEIARQVQSRLQGGFSRQALLLIPLIWVLEGPVNIVIFHIFSLFLSRGVFSLEALSGLIWLSLQGLARYPLSMLRLADAITLVGISYCLRPRSAVQAESESLRSWESGHYGGIGGYQDMEMLPSKSHTTRLLCASAFLGGMGFSQQVLQFLDDRNRAVAPEVGTDLGLVARVCKFAQDRNRRFQWWFGACGLLASLGVMVNPAIGILLLVLGGAGLCLAKMWPERFTFARSFAKTVFDPERVAAQFGAQLEPEQVSSLPHDDQNLIVYQGFSPFVGAGLSLGGWSFVVNVEKGKENMGSDLETVKFQPAEIYARINHCVESLGLGGLSHRDMFFVHGSDIRNSRNILPDAHGRPVQFIDGAQTQKYVAASDHQIRHYKWIRVMDWGNELTTSYFLRCTLQGSNMFVEINRYLLTPLAATYRTVDAVAEAGWTKRAWVVVIALVGGPFWAAFAPLILLVRAQKALAELLSQKEKQRKKLIDEHPLYNYGVARSFREATSSDQFTHYFQKLDGDFYSKVLEREILAAIVDFLDEHNIDTSELKERQSTILNSGIIIHGGDVKAESLAVGTGAQAVKVSRPEPLQKPKFRHAVGGAQAS